MWTGHPPESVVSLAQFNISLTTFAFLAVQHNVHTLAA
jgi:hypothetical protein